MNKKVLIATGGTGGHIYPAIGLAEELSSMIENCSIHLAGNDLHKSTFLKSIPFQTHSILSSRFYFKNPFRFLLACYKITKGFRQSIRLIKKIQPDYIVGFGSFHTFPLLLAAILKKIPIILHEGNAYPGKVNRFISRFSHYTAIQFPEAGNHLRGEKREALLPLRKALRSVNVSQEDAKELLNLQKDRFTILIFGGSLGASFLNMLMQQALPNMLTKFSPIQFIHITGQNESQLSTLKECYKKTGLPYFIAPYYFDMGILWKAADLCISRSGAATIREMIAFEIPSILIPYPFAADNHQEKNAAFMSSKVGGAFMSLQKEMSSTKLLTIFEKLFSHKMATYKAMKQALRSYKKRSERVSFAEMVKKTVER